MLVMERRQLIFLSVITVMSAVVHISPFISEGDPLDAQIPAASRFCAEGNKLLAQLWILFLFNYIFLINRLLDIAQAVS